MSYELEILPIRGARTVLHFRLKPAHYVCRDLIAEHDAPYGYLVCRASNGREVSRIHLYASEGVNTL